MNVSLGNPISIDNFYPQSHRQKPESNGCRPRRLIYAVEGDGQQGADFGKYGGAAAGRRRHDCERRHVGNLWT